MGLVKRIRNAWNGSNIPKAPTASDFNHAPPAQFGAYDPNAAMWTQGGQNNGVAPRQSSGRPGTAAIAATASPWTSPGGGTQALTPGGQTSNGPVAMGSVRGDDQGMAAARQALAQMQERSTSGWSQLDRMALDQAQRQAGQYEQAQRGAVQQNAAARGLRGSGLEMLGAMTAQQGGADRALDAATTLGIAGRDRAMANTSQAAQLGMGINDQQFAQNAARAGAVDAFNQWASGKQDQAAAMAYQAALGRYQQLQDQRQRIMQGVGQGVGMLGGLFGGGGGGGQ